MPRSCRPSLAALLLAVSLGGCASTVPALFADNGPSNDLADRFSRLLDERCPLPADPAIALMAQRQMRLLRAQWLLAVLARYGSARIEDFSGDKNADAAMLLARVNRSTIVIKRARADLARDPNQFEVYRADLIVALLNAANAAIEPTLRSVSGFVIKPNPEDGLNLLGNYFKDRLYAHAYGVTCSDFMQAAAVPSRRPQVQQRVDEQLREQCDRLASQTGLDTRCINPASE
jgi:hypothetical protein